MTALDEKIGTDAGIHAEDTGMTCAFCKGRTFRRSRLKLRDVGNLLTLHYPVRCLSCSKRQSVGLDIARRAVPSTVRQVRAPKNDGAWDGSPWSQPRPVAEPGEASFIGGSVRAAVSEAPSPRGAMAMPDLQGVRLPHVANLPPGDGENLA